jgi:hypothetical protein
MQIVEGLQEIPHDTDCILFLVQSLGLDPLEKLSSLEIFKDQMDVLVTFVDFIKLDNVLVIYAPENVNLE